jgi:RNA polymerase sigma-70 factor, ECF subfamily
MTRSGNTPRKPFDRTSLTLLGRARAMDSAAWERLVSLYNPLVHYWCRRSGLQSADAADVAQEVFAAVAHGLPSYHHDRPADSFRGWLRRLTANKVRDRSRRRPRERVGLRDSGVIDPSSGVNAEEAEHSEEVHILLKQALRQIEGEFAPRIWQAFLLTVIKERSVHEVANKLGVTANAVYLARSRVTHRLREQFKGLLE